VRFRWLLLIPAILLLTLPGLPEPSQPRPTKFFQTEPPTALVAVVCLHRSTVDQIIDLLLTDQRPDQVKGVLRKEVALGECWTLPEPIEMEIAEYTTPSEQTFPVPDEDRWSRRVVLFEAIRVRSYWTILELPLFAS
jgi:hypothetical protein